MKNTDILAMTLKELGITRVYGLQGGSVAHIFDSLEKFEIEVNYLHHEESCALSAAAASTLPNTVGVLVVTTGPAGTNALTGVLGAWQDSLPLIIISGQARSNQLSYETGLRQFGSQEAPILDIVKPITKKTYLVMPEEMMKKVVRDAYFESRSGRPGPVWIDIPIDVQLMDVDVQDNATETLTEESFVEEIDQRLIDDFHNSLNPILVLGGGTKQILMTDASLCQKMDSLGIPIFLTWTSASLASKLENYCGILGQFGHNSANNVATDADFILALGSNLSTMVMNPLQIKIRDTKLHVHNIDPHVLDFVKKQYSAITHQGDLKVFLSYFLSKTKKVGNKNSTRLARKELDSNLEECNYRLRETYERTGKLHSHGVVEFLTRRMQFDNLIIDGGGTALYSGFQAGHLQNFRNIVCSAAISSMGTSIAQSIVFTDSSNLSLSIIGDGSFIMALRDLASICKNSRLVILVINNCGYLAIRHTQKDYLSSKFLGTFYLAGDELPEIEPIVKGFGLRYKSLKTLQDLENFSEDKVYSPIVVEAFCDPIQEPMWPLSKRRIQPAK